MNFVTFNHNNEEKYGILSNCKNYVIDVKEVESKNFSDTILPNQLVDTLGNEQAQNRLNEIKTMLDGSKDLPLIPFADIELMAPIPRPKRNIFCLGINYKEHAYEFEKTSDDNKAIPKYPIVFSKLPSTVVGPNDEIKSHRDVTSELDYEAELAIIIGKEGTNIPKDQAYDYIFGYTAVNDVTARDMQRNHKQWLLGKGLDTFCPMGPVLVSADEIATPISLNVQSRVNGELRQNSNTDLLIFDIPTIISTLSNGITLQPGDIIATGTPKGVGMGFEPPRFLKPGDVVEVEIDQIGILKNTVN